MLLCILIFTFLDAEEKTEGSGLNEASFTRIQSSLYFLVNIILSVTVVPKYLNCSTFSKDVCVLFISPI
jgi:hypothetical protein